MVRDRDHRRPAAGGANLVEDRRRRGMHPEHSSRSTQGENGRPAVWRPLPLRVGESHEDARLVERHPPADVVSERLGAGGRIAAKEAWSVGVEDAPAIRQPDGQGEVVECDHRFHPQLAADGDHLRVVAQGGEVEAARLGLDPGPLHREPLGRVPHFREQRQVLAIAVEVIDGDRRRVAVLDPPRLVALHAHPVVPEAALDLVRGTGGAEQEALRDAKWAGGQVAMTETPQSGRRCRVVSARARGGHRSGR